MRYWNNQPLCILEGLAMNLRISLISQEEEERHEKRAWSSWLTKHTAHLSEAQTASLSFTAKPSLPPTLIQVY